MAVFIEAWRAERVADLETAALDELVDGCRYLLQVTITRSRQAEYPLCRGHYDRPPCDFPVPPIRLYTLPVFPESTEVREVH